MKEIEFIIDDQPCLNQNQIEFFNWISAYYLCPIGKVYETALPKLFLIKSETIIDVILNNNSLKISKNANDLYKSISNFKEISMVDLIKLFGKESMKLINELAVNDLVKIREEIFDNYKPKTKTVYELHPEQKVTQSVISGLRSQNHKKILNFFLNEKSNFKISQQNLLKKFNISNAVLNGLVKKTLLVKKKLRVDRFEHFDSINNNHIQLSNYQNKALLEIKEELNNNKVILFKGVTSSGKTEIYIKLIKEIISKKLNVLFLVPEIALTTQLVSRLQSYFPTNLHVYHSGINPNLRYEIWNDLNHNNKPKVILGARSSIFLPFSCNSHTIFIPFCWW